MPERTLPLLQLHRVKMERFAERVGAVNISQRRLLPIGNTFLTSCNLAGYNTKCHTLAFLAPKVEVLLVAMEPPRGQDYTNFPDKYSIRLNQCRPWSMEQLEFVDGIVPARRTLRLSL